VRFDDQDYVKKLKAKHEAEKKAKELKKVGMNSELY
jgi:hypothetical protein